MSRRRWLHRLFAGAGLALSAPLLQACGGTASTVVTASTGTTTTAPSTAAATSAAATTTSAAAAATASTSAAAAAPAGGVTLDFTNWAYAETATKANIQKVVTAFSQQSGIKVTMTPIGFNDIQQQLIVRVNGGNSPDLSQVSSQMPFVLAGIGALAPLDPYVTAADKADNYSGAWDGGVADGKLVALPWAITPHAFWFNKQLMTKAGLDPAKPPTTIDELGTALAQVKAKLPATVFPFGLDDKQVAYAIVNQWPFMREFGGNVATSTAPTFNTKPMVDYFTWLRNLAQKQYIPLGKILGNLRTTAANGQEVFAFDGPYYVGALRNVNKALAGDAFYTTFGVTTTPIGALGKPVTAADNHQLSLFKASKQPDAAWKLMHFLTHDATAVQQYLLPQGALPPLQSQARTFAQQLSDPVSQVYLTKILPTMAPMPYSSKWAAAVDVMTAAMATVLSGTDAIQAILDGAQSKLVTVYKS